MAKLGIFLFTSVLAIMVAISTSRADVIDRENGELSGQVQLENLAYIQQYTNIDSNDLISGTFEQFVNALKAASKLQKTDSAYPAAVEKADIAYEALIAAYEGAIGRLRNFEGEQYKEIFDVIQWDQAAFAGCVDRRTELLELLKSGGSGVQEVATDKAALSDQLRECADRVEAVSVKLKQFIRSTNEEIAKDKERLEQAKIELAAAKAAGDTEKADALQKEIAQLEEEIPKQEETVKKAQEVSSGFDLEKFLQGLGKVVLGIVTIIFSGECEEDAESCNQVGVELIKGGFEDVTESFDATETEIVDVTVAVPAERPADVETKETTIREAVEAEPVVLCCALPPETTLIPTDEEGALSFAFELSDGRVSKLVLIQNSDGARIADITDTDLFFIKPVTLSVFTLIASAKTLENSSGTHILLVEGPDADGSTVQMAIALSPLTHKGKFKVALGSTE